MYTKLNQTTILGKRLFYMPSCHSTNDEASKRIKSNIFQFGDLFITDHQLSGKGQRGNKWISEPSKNLTFSVIWDGAYFKSSSPFGFTMAVSLAIVKFLNLPHFKIKWPNDIYYKKSKLGGILIENIFQSNGQIVTIIGIGLNINQVEFDRLNAISLRVINNVEYDLEDVLQKLGLAIEIELLKLDQLSFEEIRSDYEHYLYLKNEWVSFTAREHQFLGKILSVNDLGKLLVELENKEIIAFDHQEIRLVLPTD